MTSIIGDTNDNFKNRRHNFICHDWSFVQDMLIKFSMRIFANLKHAMNDKAILWKVGLDIDGREVYEDDSTFICLKKF